jgi:hypothetical protein
VAPWAAWSCAVAAPHSASSAMAMALRVKGVFIVFLGI